MKYFQRFSVALLYLVIALGFSTAPCTADSEIFLKFDEEWLEGESKDFHHQNWIRLSSFSWKPSQENLGTLTITKPLDKATPGLLRALLSKKAVVSGTLEVTRSVSDKPVFLKMEFEKIAITSVSTGGKPEDDLPVETISLTFEKVTYTYTELDPATHASKGSTVFTWDSELQQGGR